MTPAAPVTVGLRRRAAGCIDRLERDQEVGERHGQLVEITNSLDARVSAGDPTVDRPGAWEPAAGHTSRDRLGDRKRQVRRQHRQPPMLLFDLPYIAVATRQPHRQVVAEPERCVVPTVEFHGRHRQVRPLRELLRDEPGRQLGRYLALLHGDIVPRRRNQ